MRQKLLAVVITVAMLLGMGVAAPAASANPLYDYAIRVLNSRNECEQTLKRIRRTLVWGACVTVPVGVTYLIGVRK